MGTERKGAGSAALEIVAGRDHGDIIGIVERVTQAGQLGVAVDGAVDVVFVKDDDGLQGAGFHFVVSAGERDEQDGQQQGKGKAFHIGLQ